jgi:hypothetical protein
MRATAAALLLAAVVAALAVQHVRAAPPRFEFRNHFWINLHHLLRGEARRRDVKATPRIRLDTLSATERATWTSALDAYADYGRLNPVFDDRLVRISNSLTRVTSDAALEPLPPGLEPNAARALTMTAPIYRTHYWLEQRQLNERWIAALEPMIASHGPAMAATLARIYGVEWPADPIIVDASSEAGANGGYTTDGPPGTAAHTVIEAANPEYQGDMAFEMVFHEASHARVVGDHLIEAIKVEAARQRVAAPRDLWHALIFYTTGEVARRELGKAGDERYKAYAYRYGVYTSGWQPLRDALERDWQPYLDRRVTFEEALSGLVRDTSTR